MTVVPLSIAILDDNILEGDENFTLAFDSSVLPGHIIPDDDNNQSTVIILDDDCEYIENTKFSVIYLRMLIENLNILTWLHAWLAFTD